MTIGEQSPQMVSLTDAAEQLGVHYMTAYRYVRTGRMHAVKQQGQWRVAQSELATILDEGTATRRAPGQEGSAGSARQQMVEPFIARLTASDVNGAWALVNDALASGATPSAVHAQLIAPAMCSIGERWATGQLTIAAEHRATAVVQQIVGRMSPMFRHPGRRRGTVVVGATAGDQHTLVSAMVADQLADRNFVVVDLGGNTPTESFIEAANDCDDLVGIAVSAMTNLVLASAREQVIELRAALQTTYLVVSGAAFDEASRRDFTDLVDAIASPERGVADIFDQHHERTRSGKLHT